MLDFSGVFIFAFALFVAAGSPGPSITALVARVLSGGWQSVLPFMAAMLVGEVAWMTAAVVGLAAMAEAFYWAFVAIKWAGIAYLAWLAWGMWNTPVDTEPDLDLVPKGRGWGMFFAGLAVTFGNPKIMIFYLALLPTLIDITAITLSGWSILAATTIVILLAIDSSWVVLATGARRLLRTPSAMRFANRTSAAAMGGAAAVMASR